MLSRRRFLAAAAASGFSRLWANHPLFEIVLPERSGITWCHDNAMSDARYLPESMGPGCAFLDYDGDGWMDLYLVNSGPSDFYTPKTPVRNALYRNNRDGTFTDVTERAGVAGGTFGFGAAVGDYDNDGRPDIFVTAYGSCRLYHNNGDGTFTDVAEKAGVASPGWTTSAVWFDYDNDGRLDLFVSSFVDYSDPNHRVCGDNRIGRKYYCIPRLFKPTHSLLYHNNGDGTFTEVSKGTGIAKALGKALGVVATDINNDGLMDLFVSNDTVENFLFLNRGGGRWEEAGIAAEVGFDEDGNPRSGMGVDAADFDNDGLEDLFVANLDHQPFSLYRNRGKELFTDVSRSQGIADATRLLSGWGLKFFDYDNDGNLDLFISNGHPDDMVEKYNPGVTFSEPLLLFHNDAGKLTDVSARAGPAFERRYNARGMAVGDFDNDGRLDVLIGINGGVPVLLRNNARAGNHWIGLKLEGTRANRDAVGARITWSVNGVRRSRLKTAGGSYLSSHDPRAILGLGTAAKADWVEVRWPGPGGTVERFDSLPVDQYTVIRQTRA
jgi:hypothetical protein